MDYIINGNTNIIVETKKIPIQKEKENISIYNKAIRKISKGGKK